MIYVSIHRISHEKELEIIPFYHLNFKFHTHEARNFTENKLNRLASLIAHVRCVVTKR
jgi:hypothetical protein